MITENQFQQSLTRVAKGTSSMVDVEIIATYVAQLNAELICLRTMLRQSKEKPDSGGSNHATKRST